MGERGPIPQPIALRELRGNPGKQSLGRKSAQPYRVAPARPPGMSARAKAIWSELEPMLVRIGLLTELDGLSFRDLCEGEAKLESRIRALGRKAEFLKTKTGYAYRNPEFEAVDKLRTGQEKRRMRFGLSPSDRARLNVKTPRGSASGVLDDPAARRGRAS